VVYIKVRGELPESSRSSTPAGPPRSSCLAAGATMHHENEQGSKHWSYITIGITVLENARLATVYIILSALVNINNCWLKRGNAGHAGRWRTTKPQRVSQQ